MKEKNPAPKRSIVDALRELDKSLGAVIAHRWYVIEIRPAYEDYDGYYVPPKTVAQSPYFDTQEEAQEFLDTHDPDDGNTLKLRHQKLYERIERRWL